MTEFHVEHISKIIPDAYHGTSSSRAKTILKYGFTHSRNEDEYLGDGIYFFEGSILQAQNWASRTFEGDIGIINAIINLNSCLDLTTEEGREIIKQCRKMMIEQKKGLSEARFPDTVIINFLASMTEIDTVRANYVRVSEKKIYPQSKFYDYSQLMICVRNEKCILKLSIVP